MGYDHVPTGEDTSNLFKCDSFGPSMNPVFYAIAYATWFLSTFYVVFFLIVLFENKDNLFERRKMPRGIYPSVSIIVPAYNEEEGIASTIASLKKI